MFRRIYVKQSFCKFCDETFQLMNHEAHEKTDFCDKTFGKQSCLEEHMLINHNEKTDLKRL